MANTKGTNFLPAVIPLNGDMPREGEQNQDFYPMLGCNQHKEKFASTVF